MSYTRSSISYDNIDYLAEKSANLFNKYIAPKIEKWCRDNNVDLLNPKNREYKIFIDKVTSRSIDLEITYDVNEDINEYRILFPTDCPLKNFIKFVLGLTYLLDPKKHLNLIDPSNMYPIFVPTYIVYNKIKNSHRLFNEEDREKLLQYIRNLWTMLFYRKTGSHANLNDEWKVLSKPVNPDPSKIDLKDVFDRIIMTQGSHSRTSVPLSLYIENQLTQVLDDLNINGE